MSWNHIRKQGRWVIAGPTQRSISVKAKINRATQGGQTPWPHVTKQTDGTFLRGAAERPVWGAMGGPQRAAQSPDPLITDRANPLGAGTGRGVDVLPTACRSDSKTNVVRRNVPWLDGGYHQLDQLYADHCAGRTRSPAGLRLLNGTFGAIELSKQITV